MLQDIQTEAIVFTSTLFKDYDRIVTLFTKESGLIKLIVRGASRPKSTKLTLCQPLTYATYVFRQKKGDLHLFMEGKVLNPFLALRDSYVHLTAGFDLMQALMKTQPDHEPSVDLFLLLKSYLNQISSFSSPHLLVTSFYLKVLLHEGCLTLKTSCSKCHQTSSNLYFCFKDYFCKNCALMHSLEFSQLELKTLFELVKERSFEALKSKSLPSSLCDKVRQLYGELYEVQL